MLDALKARSRVVVTGRISYNAKHEPLSVEVRGPLRFLKEEAALPTVSDLAGSDPSMTGDMSTEEFGTMY